MENKTPRQNDIFKRNIKTVDAVSYNGRYVEASTLRNKIISFSIALAALASAMLYICL